MALTLKLGSWPVGDAQGVGAVDLYLERIAWLELAGVVTDYELRNSPDSITAFQIWTEQNKGYQLRGQSTAHRHINFYADVQLEWVEEFIQLQEHECLKGRDAN